MTPASLESHVEAAARARSVLLAFERAAFVGGPEPLAAVPDIAPLAAVYASTSAVDPAGARLIGEVVARASLRAPARSYRVAWRDEPIVLRGEAPIALRSLPSVVALESNEHRRRAIANEADARAHQHLRVARAIVDATREIATHLGLDTATSVHDALGFGAPEDVRRAADAVLAATAEAFRELDAWIRGRLGLARRGELAWHDRLRTLATPRANERIPLGDRAGIASRWVERIGLGAALGRVRDQTSRPSSDGVGVRVFADLPGETVLIAGTTTVAALGGVDLSGAIAEAVALAVPDEQRAADRLGLERVHTSVAESLGRGLWLEPAFVTREASVDRAAREPVSIELLHAMLWVARFEAALARFGLDVLARASDLPSRFRESLAAALQTAPAPSWAAHLGAQLFELRAGPRTIATLLEARWHEALRDQHDEDWFRNPRAGDSVKARLDAMRSHGAIDAFATTPDTRDALFDPAPLARRVSDAMNAAHGRVS